MGEEIKFEVCTTSLSGASYLTYLTAIAISISLSRSQSLLNRALLGYEAL